MADIGEVKKQDISTEMRDSYLDYAMSVIISRALPDVRDGLKPVHRRILYAMRGMGLKRTGKHTKSAKVVGEVLGKYHPHGDVPVYDAIARMAQDFSMRYMLVNGQGNFGSIDGDRPAAMRYTEVRMEGITEEMLADLEKNTVPFVENYDGTEKEPTVLPSKIPQLLLNGSVGIAVGMATNIPPHNLSELLDALSYLIDHPKATSEDLMQFIQGPDFPTGGVAYNYKDIREAYSTGKGPILVRGKTDIVEGKKDRFQIIISEIPFQVSKAALIEKMAELVKDKKIEGIKDIRDESDKDGLRIVIDLKGDAYPQKILNSLYKHTDLQKTFHVNMLALVDGIQPQILSLKGVLEQFILHRQTVVRKRTEFDLEKEKERMHILEGLHIALDNIDAVIKTIRSSDTREIAQKNLMNKFKLTDRQANAILDMRLATLAALERLKIDDELKEKRALIKELTSLLKDEQKILGVIKKEFSEIKAKYADPRRTKVVKTAPTEIKTEDLVPEEEALITLSFGGFIKRTDPEFYRVQKRGGKGVLGATTKDTDPIEHFVTVNTHDYLLFFSSMGRLFQARAFDIPEASRVARGKAIVNFLNLGPQERITAILTMKEKPEPQLEKNRYFMMATHNGKIKKTSIGEFRSNRKNGLLAIKLSKGDYLRWVKETNGSDEVILTTKAGASIRFSEKDVRPMGRSASGVAAMRLKQGDEVVGMDVLDIKQPSSHLLTLTANGYGKRTPINEYRAQKRGGSGILTAKITDKTGSLVLAFAISDETDLIAISQKGQVVRVKLEEISELGRATQGVRVMKLALDDKLASAALL